MATYKYNTKIWVSDNSTYSDLLKTLNSKIEDTDSLQARINNLLSTQPWNTNIKYDNVANTIDAPKELKELSKKSKLKAQLKSEIHKRFKIGDFICLRTKAKGACKRIERVYQIKQIVWCMNDLVLKALVVKQISGPNYNMFSMNRYDCARVHVKYEPGLQFLSMELPWLPVKPSVNSDNTSIK